MHRQIYHDIVGHISLANGMVRFDFYDEVPEAPQDAAKEGPPQYEMSRRLVMPLASVLQTWQMLDGVVAKLREAGLVRPAAPEEDKA
ncbi:MULTISPECIES: hypothetical protein [unclassified Desulfovibrio]|uniref:hypothetical protein n=1 Tax=unclassified Desulfovibrio TaxID=2593640 RepID=UPI0013EBF999|nr:MULTISPECIES: hypothetical protein [unclassified Desulfovibrio]